MQPPLYQRASKIGIYILGGFLALGAVLDSLSNAIALLTPFVASVGTVCIVLLWLWARFVLPSHPLLWVVGDQPVLIRKVGIKPKAFAAGMGLLLWMPSVLMRWQSPPPIVQPPAEVRILVEQLIKAQEREQRERGLLQDQIKALTEAVTALTQQQGPRVADALTQLRQGNTTEAESIFQDILTREAAKGQAAHQQAAEAARHLGALAFLHDTSKALTAYHEAVRLDPENTEGWTQFGHLLLRLGQLDDAADAYHRVLTRGEALRDRDLVARAYHGLGVVADMRGNLVQADALFRKALELYQALGDKAGMVRTYQSLGIIADRRGDLAQADAILRNVLELYQGLGDRAGMAKTYQSLSE